MKYLTEERFIVHSNTKEAMKNYADNYDRIFRCEPAPEEAKPESDALEMRFVMITHYCKVCDAYVPDPENHQHHAVICTQPGYNVVVEIPGDDEPCDHCSCAAGASCSSHEE